MSIVFAFKQSVTIPLIVFICMTGQPYLTIRYYELHVPICRICFLSEIPDKMWVLIAIDSSLTSALFLLHQNHTATLLAVIVLKQKCTDTSKNMNNFKLCRFH